MYFNKSLNQSYEQFQDFLLADFNWFISGKGLHKYLFSSDPALLNYLKTFNMHHFHSTNHSWELISLHQIIAFFFCGGQQAQLNGFTCNRHLVEVHHLSADTRNCHPSNLVYITTELHDIITSRQRSIKRQIRHFRSKAKRKNILINTTIWNRRGEPVKRLYDWAASLLIKTIVSTAAHFNILINFKVLGKFILSVKHYWKIHIPDCFIPNIFNSFNSLITSYNYSLL